MKYLWDCPYCYEQNMDDWNKADFPRCENCGREFYWEDILEAEDDPAIYLQYMKETTL